MHHQNITTENVEEIWLQVIPLKVKWRLIQIAAVLDAACLKHEEFPSDRIHQAAIVCEEAGEVVQAALNHRYEKEPLANVELELLQTAAAALRMLLHTNVEPVQDKWIKELDTQAHNNPNFGASL